MRSKLERRKNASYSHYLKYRIIYCLWSIVSRFRLMDNNENQKTQKRQKKEYLIQAWITEDMLNELEHIEEKYGLTKAVIIRQALKTYIKGL